MILVRVGHGREEAGAPDGVSIYAAPTRATDLSGLPPAYIDVGGLDLVRDEDTGYARRLNLAGVSTELHITPGVPHAFEILVPHTNTAQRVLDGRYRFLRRL